MRDNILFALIGGFAIGGFGLLRSFLSARLLGPAPFGEWSLLQLVLSYAAFSHLGVAVAMPNEMVVREAEGNSFGAIEVAQGGLWLILGMSGVISLAILLFPAAWLGDILSRHRGWTAAVLLSQQLLLHVGALLRGRIDFVRIALGQVLFGGLSIVLMLLLAPRFETRGALAAMAFANLVGAMVGIRWVVYYGMVLPRLAALRNLLTLGFPLLLNLFIGTALQNVDRVIVGRLMGSMALGVYSVSNLFVTPVMFLPAVLGGLVMTHFARATVVEDERGIQKDIFRFSLAISIALAVLTALMIIFSPFILGRFLPHYSGSVGTVRVLLIGSYFYGSTLLLVNFMVANRRQALLLRVQCMGLFLVVVFCWIAIRWKWGMLGIGWANFIAYMIYWVMVTVAVCYAMGWKLTFFIKAITVVLVPAMFMAGVCMTSFLFHSYFVRNIVPSMSFLLIACGVCLLGGGVVIFGCLLLRRDIV